MHFFRARFDQAYCFPSPSSSRVKFTISRGCFPQITSSPKKLKDFVTAQAATGSPACPFRYFPLPFPGRGKESFFPKGEG